MIYKNGLLFYYNSSKNANTIRIMTSFLIVIIFGLATNRLYDKFTIFGQILILPILAVLLTFMLNKILLNIGQFFGISTDTIGVYPEYFAYDTNIVYYTNIEMLIIKDDEYFRIKSSNAKEYKINAEKYMTFIKRPNIITKNQQKNFNETLKAIIDNYKSKNNNAQIKYLYK